MDQLQRTSSKFTILGSIDKLHVAPGCLIVRAPWPFFDTTGSDIILGPQVVINAGVYIHTHSHRFHEANWRDLPIVTNRTPTCIEAGAFLGVNAQILHTCKYIGRNSVVAAGSIVTRNIPDNEIWAGNPAQKIGDVDASEVKGTTSADGYSQTRTVQDSIQEQGRA